MYGFKKAPFFQPLRPETACNCSQEHRPALRGRLHWLGLGGLAWLSFRRNSMHWVALGCFGWSGLALFSTDFGALGCFGLGFGGSGSLFDGIRCFGLLWGVWPSFFHKQCLHLGVLTWYVVNYPCVAPATDVGRASSSSSLGFLWVPMPGFLCFSLGFLCRRRLGFLCFSLGFLCRCRLGFLCFSLGFLCIACLHCLLAMLACNACLQCLIAMLASFAVSGPRAGFVFCGA